MEESAFKLMTFYILLAVGMLLRKTSLPHKKIGNVLITWILPFLFFAAALFIKDDSLLRISAFAFVTAACVLYVGYQLLRRSIGSQQALAMSTMSAWANNAFLGMPLAFAMFGQRGLEIASLWALGSITLFALVGSTLVVNGTSSTLPSGLSLIKKLIFPPFLPAFLLGLSLNKVGIVDFLPLDIINMTKSAGFVVAVIYVGMCLRLGRQELDFRFASKVLVMKHILYPVIVMLFIGFDALVAHLFKDSDYVILLLMATMPIAVNVVVLYQDNDEYVAKAAFCVTASTLVCGAVVTMFFLC